MSGGIDVSAKPLPVWAATIKLAGSATIILSGWVFRQRRLKGGAEPRRENGAGGRRRFQTPLRGTPAVGRRGWYRSSFDQRYERDAEPSRYRPPGDALHDSFPTPRPRSRRGNGRLQLAHRAPHRQGPAFAISEKAGANVANPLRPADACLAAGSGDARDSRRHGRDDLRGPSG